MHFLDLEKYGLLYFFFIFFIELKPGKLWPSAVFCCLLGGGTIGTVEERVFLGLAEFQIGHP